MVYIVILNYKIWNDVIECLQSVFLSTYRQFKVFVIDNNSANDSLQHLADWAMGAAHPSVLMNSLELDRVTDLRKLPSLIFVQNDKNNGFAGGNNVVLRNLTSENAFVWLLNPDVVIKEDCLAELVSFAHLQQQPAIIGCLIKFQYRPDLVHMYGGGKVIFNSATASLITDVSKIASLEYISGGSLFTNASLFQLVGLLPEKYFLYWEETDWCYQAKSKGYSLAVCMTAICYDKVGTSIGRGFMAEYYYTRNGLLFLHKYKKGKLPLALFLSSARIFKKILMGQWKRALGVWRGVQSFRKMNSDAKNK